MKIAFFVTSFPTLSETFIASQLIVLQNSGHTVHIFSQQRPTVDKVHEMVLNAGLLKNTFYLSDIPKSRIGKIKTLLYKLAGHSPVKNIKKVCRAAFKNKGSLSVYDLIPFLDKPEYDILHAHFGINGNYVTGLLHLGLFKNARFVTTFHGYDLNQKLRENGFYAALFAACNVYTVNTNYSKKLLLNLGCGEDKIKVLPVGLDTANFKKTGVHPRDNLIRILFVGRLVEYKAPDNVVEICSLLKKRNGINFSAKIVGDGPMLQSLRQLLNDKGLQAEVEITGSKTQEEIRMMMNEADLFLFPGISFESRAENQGLVIQEAQAMQLPVLISDAGGMAEGVLDGISGFVLPQNDLQAFAAKIELLANDSELRKKMGAAGRDFVEERYDVELLNTRLLSLYEGEKDFKKVY